MFELYAKFIGKNEEEIVDDFCTKVKSGYHKETVGELTLDEYSRFRFWKDYTSKELDHFYNKYKDDTGERISYDNFCELMWGSLNEDMPGGLGELVDSMKSLQIGEA